MRIGMLLTLAVALLALGAPTADAQPRRIDRDIVGPPGEDHFTFRQNGVRSTGNVVTRRGFGRQRHGFGGYAWGPGCYEAGYYNAGYWDTAYYGGGYYGGAYPAVCSACGCSYNFCVCRTPWLIPPVVVDFRSVYGPFLPAVANNNPGQGFFAPAAAQPVVEAPVNPPINPIDRLPPAPVFADAPGGVDLKRAWRYIDYGDRYFREGKLRSAYSRYRKAEDAAPDLADVYFRQAFVELALDNIGKGAVALRRGLRLDPRWPQSDFRLDAVFSDEGRVAALRLLDEQLKEFPNDADARLLAGVILHFHGEQAAAQEQFQRAVKVTGGRSVARLFLPEQPEAQDAAELLK